MLLKTTCEGCIFKEPDMLGCEIGKAVSKESTGRQVTYGLCGHRRESKWAEELLQNDLAFTIDRSFEYADGENRTLSIMILDQVADVDRLKKTLSTVCDDTGTLKEVMYVTSQCDNETSKVVLDILSDFDNWKFEKLLGWEEFNPQIVTDFASRNIGSCWFMPIMAGQTLRCKSIESIYDVLADHKNNPVAFLIDDFIVAVPKFAFEAMGGNTEIPWLEKVQEFENWKDVCIKIK